jgi:hypothetical protein
MNQLMFLILSFSAMNLAEDSKPGYDHHHHHHHFCMPHCSYVCLASAGKIETCANLLNPSNTTMSNLPDMAACPSANAPIDDCMMKCGCQCTRCGVCLLRNMKTAKEDCKASPDPKKCMQEKKAEALKKCN